ncbi:MAG: mechanosensitive ion channel [Gammaproteobacteria bacterium]|jgi:small-conductance mechanosensitive channel|nr:mechanosensitive ion channel [Gammaproteobacteria bacterium]
MTEFFSPDNMAQFLQQLQQWMQANVLVPENVVQVLVSFLLFLLARFLSPRLDTLLTERVTLPFMRRVAEAGAGVSLALPWLLMQWLVLVIAAAASLPYRVLEIVASLLSAWVIIRLVSQMVRDPLLSRMIAWVAWSVAALNIVGLLLPAIEILDSVAVTLGGIRVSPYTVVKSTMALGVLLWAAFAASSMFEARIRSSTALSPSLQVLMSKALKIVLVSLAVVIAVRSVGIDLTALTVFGGAIALGIGFGLQKIIANLVAGLILLLDKSIKPGDVIAVEETYGWVNTLGGRYVSVITRDGTEHLIPNETLITNRVENWTHSNNRVRLKVPIGVHYKSDVHKAIALCIDAAAQTRRVLAIPAPACLVKGFGTDSVDLEIRFWIEDAANGISNVRSDILLKVWDSFLEHGIEIPYPQRDLHLRSPESLLQLLAARAAAQDG